MPGPVRIVGIRFLNARPLLAGLEAGVDAPFAYQLSTAEPAANVRTMDEAGVAAGLVPVVGLASHPEAAPVPGLGIACRRETTSVLLVSKVPLARIRSLAAHRASRTSVALARLLLRRRWGADPTVVAATPPVDSMLDEADAAVIIGDPALEARGTTGMLEVDLASSWVEWTGMPFVFAVWAALPSAPPGTPALLADSYAYARRHWDELIPRWSRSHRLSEDATRRYLERALTFELGGDEEAAMAHFLDLVREEDLVDTVS